MVLPEMAAELPKMLYRRMSGSPSSAVFAHPVGPSVNTKSWPEFEGLLSAVATKVAPERATE